MDRYRISYYIYRDTRVYFSPRHCNHSLVPVVNDLIVCTHQNYCVYLNCLPKPPRTCQPSSPIHQTTFFTDPSVYPTDPTPVHLNHNLHSHLHTDQVTNKGVSPIRLVTKYDTKHYSIISSIKGHLISKDKKIEKKAVDVIKENQHCCVVGYSVCLETVHQTL